jgi:hypothetical protein
MEINYSTEHLHKTESQQVHNLQENFTPAKGQK